MSGTTPAGWYEDGVTAGHERYWDGTQWTDEYRALGAVPADQGTQPPAAVATPRQPTGLAASFRQVWRGVTLLARGYAEHAVDEALSIETRGGRRLFVWAIPATINAILVGFFLVALVAAPVGIIREQLGGLVGSFGGGFSTAGMAGPLAGAFFVGLAFGALFFFVRAGALVLTARVRGGRIAFWDALIVVTTSHGLTAFGWVLATVLLAIPGQTGIILAVVVEVFVGLPLLLLAEQAILQGASRVTGFAHPPLAVNALFGGLAIAIVYAGTMLAAIGLMQAGVQAVTSGFASGFSGLVG